MAEKDLSTIKKTSKKKTQEEKSKEKTKAAVLKEKEKQQAKQKEQAKAIVEKEKEKQKLLLEREREKQKEQQKLAITNAIAKEREKQKDAQQKAIDKAIAKERAKIREALVSGKDPFAKDNPLSKAQLKKSTQMAQKDEEEFNETSVASLAQKLEQKKSIDDILKEKEAKESTGTEEKLDHVELLRRKREAQMKLNSSQEESSDKENELRAKLQAKQLQNQEDNIPEVKEVVVEKIVVKEDKELIKKNEELNEKVSSLNSEKENLELKVKNLLVTIDEKNALLKEKDSNDDKELVKKNEELNEKVSSLNSEKENLELKVKNLLVTIDEKNALLKEKEDKKPAKKSKDNNEALLLQLDSLKKEKENLETKVNNLLEELNAKNEIIASKDGEINVLGLEVAKLTEMSKEEPKVEVTPEVEKIKATGDLLLKIQFLQERIKEKDAEIKVIEDELNNLSEKDIVDKEFLTLIKRIREERNEIVEQANKNLSSLAGFVTSNEEKLNNNKKFLNEKTLELEQFDSEYQELKGKLSYDEREQLMRKRSRLCAEKDAISINIEILEDSYNNYYNRYNNELERAEKGVTSLNEKEKALINEYLEKLKEAKAESNDEYKVQVEEREKLIQELEDANKEALKETKAEEVELASKESVNPEDDEVLVNLKSSLAQIDGKLGMLANKRDERNNVEKVLRLSDEDVKAYLKLYSEKETLSFVISEDQNRLNKASVELRDNPLKPKKSFFGKVRYDQNDIEADKKRKDDVARLEAILLQNKARLDQLEEEIKKYDYNDKVLFYKKLLSSIAELNNREVELQKREQEIKESILNREEELKSGK